MRSGSRPTGRRFWPTTRPRIARCWFGEQVAGHVASFVLFGEREVTYWIGREFWGRGIATAALAALLREVDERPLHARAASDNLASRRVLEKCGFVFVGTDRGFANARGAEIDAVILRLDGVGDLLDE